MDDKIVRYAPIGEITDQMKIDAMKNLAIAKLGDAEYDAFVEKQVADRAPLLKIVGELVTLIDQTEDAKDKTALQNSLNQLKPLMAEHGIFLEEDKRDRALVELWLEKAEQQQESFRSNPRSVSFDSGHTAMVSNVSHANAYYTVRNYIEYSCSAGVNCKIGPQTWYTNGGGAIISQTGTMPSDLVAGNITEWITKITNNIHGTSYQGSYHQGIHYDSNWNYLSGNTKSLNLWYYSGQTHVITVHSVFNANIGDKTYLYVYIA